MNTTQMDDDYGHYCDLEYDYANQMATKVYRTNHYYVVTNHYVHYDCERNPEYYYDTEDAVDVIKDHKEKATTKMLTKCIDFSVFCIFVGTTIYCITQL